MTEKKDEKRVIAFRKLLSAAFYLAMIGVVIYGSHQYVYDGFGKAAPWIVSFIFLLIAGFRIYGFITSVKADRSLMAYRQFRDTELSDEDGESDDDVE